MAKWTKSRITNKIYWLLLTANKSGKLFRNKIVTNIFRTLTVPLLRIIGVAYNGLRNSSPSPVMLSNSELQFSPPILHSTFWSTPRTKWNPSEKNNSYTSVAFVENLYLAKSFPIPHKNGPFHQAVLSFVWSNTGYASGLNPLLRFSSIIVLLSHLCIQLVVHHYVILF